MTVSKRLGTVVLAGGKGLRLQSVVRDRPKPMAEVAGRPFLEWLLLALRRQGLRRVVLCTGHMARAIEDHFRDGAEWGMDISYSREPVPLGTAGALRHALAHLTSDRLLVLNGDSYCHVEVEELYQAHVSRHALGTLWLVPQQNRSRYGNVLAAADGSVLEFSEKASRETAGLINAGVYLLEREILESLPQGVPLSLERDLFPRLVGRGLYAVVGQGPFLDIGTPEAFAEAEAFVVREMAA